MMVNKRALTLIFTLVTVLLIFVQLLSCLTLAYPSKVLVGNDVIEYNLHLEVKEFHQYQPYKQFKQSENDIGPFEKKKDVNEPPPVDQVARMARYIVNQSNWTSMATFSSRTDTKSYPFASITSISDGLLGYGTGIPYMYLTPLDFTGQDVRNNNQVSLMMTLAQGNWCVSKNYDPMDPRCARVMFTGRIEEIKKNDSEYEIAKNTVFSRHPSFVNLPKDHYFFFAKLNINTINVLDSFGGPKFVTLKEYLNVSNFLTLY